MHVTSSQSMIDNQETILTSVDRMEFISLLSGMLTMDPNQRIRPFASLQTPFITMQHLAMHTNTQTVWEWIQAMSVCHQPRLVVPTTSTAVLNPGGLAHHNQIQLLGPAGGCRHIQYPGITSYPVLPQGGAHLVRLHH